MATSTENEITEAYQNSVWDYLCAPMRYIWIALSFSGHLG